MLKYIVPTASTLLFDAAKEDVSIFLHEIEAVYMIYNLDFRNFLEAHGNVVGGLLEKNADLVQTDPWYNVGNEQSIDHSSHDNKIFTPERMSDFVEFSSQILSAGVLEMFSARGCRFPSGKLSWKLCRKKC